MLHSTGTTADCKIIQIFNYYPLRRRDDYVELKDGGDDKKYKIRNTNI